MHHLDAYVEAMEPARFTTRQAATLVGRSMDTLKRWRRAGIAPASDNVTFGAVTVVLYTADDLVTLHRVARSLKPGRKRKQPQQ